MTQFYGYDGLDIKKIPYWRRSRGYSAMVRLKDEAEWVQTSLLSIKDIYDDIDCFVQPSSDNTLEIVLELNLPNLRVWEYPYVSLPNGPGYCEQDEQLPNSRTFFYNWCLSRTRRKWVTKWDGDMIAHEHYGEFKKLTKKYCAISEKGTDLVGKDLAYVSKIEHTGTEVRHFSALKSVNFINGENCEFLKLPKLKSYYFGKKEYRIGNIKSPTFIHLKYVKSVESATKAFPENWQTQNDHFKSIMQKKTEKFAHYKGKYPKILVDKMNQTSSI